MYFISYFSLINKSTKNKSREQFKKWNNKMNWNCGLRIYNFIQFCFFWFFLFSLFFLIQLWFVRPTLFYQKKERNKQKKETKVGDLILPISYFLLIFYFTFINIYFSWTRRTYCSNYWKINWGTVNWLMLEFFFRCYLLT